MFAFVYLGGCGWGRVGVRVGAEVWRKGQAGGQKEFLVEMGFEPATSVVLSRLTTHSTKLSMLDDCVF